MSKRIWGTLEGFIPEFVDIPQVGRHVANRTFFYALMKYSTFDEFHFFLANQAHKRRFEQVHGEILGSIGRSDRIRLFFREQLLEITETVDYTVFHLSDHITFFNSLCYLRNQCGRFPVTAFIHSLSYQRFMAAYAAMCHGGVTRSDAMVCSTEMGAEVVRRCLDRAAS